MLAGNWQTMTAGRTRSPAELVCAWGRLIDRTLAPAGLNSPELLLPLFQHVGGAELATVEAEGELLMALPVSRRKFPFPLTSNWITPLTLSGHPHLDGARAEAVLRTFLDDRGGPVLLRSIATSGVFWDALQSAAGRMAVIEAWERAALRPRGSYGAWLETAVDGKRRKEWRRLRARLEELGRLEFVVLKPGEDATPWAKEFLGLEASGWKGRAGTALAANPAVGNIFPEICRNLAGAGKLRFWKLVLDGRPIAMLFAFVEGDQAWLGKIAYDEDLARYSPGVLVVLAATERLFDEPGLACVDSCAIPGHPMIDRLWRDRLAVADVLVAPAGYSKVRFERVAAAEKAYRRLRGLTRDAYYALRGRRRS